MAEITPFIDTRACLEWANDYVTCTPNDCTPVFLHRRVNVVCEIHGQAGFAPVCVAVHDRFGRGSAILLARITAYGKTDLHVIETTH